MTEGTNEAAEAVRATLERIRTSRALYFAAKGTMAEVSNRVWGEGKLTDGGELQYDEDYEVYAYTPPSPRKVTGVGKPYAMWKRPPANAKGKARKIKGGWYKSYLSYKEQQGRKETPFELTGRLRKAYFSGTDNPASLVEQSDTESFIFLSGENAGKYKGLTDNKGEFLQFNDAEKESYRRRLIDLLATE